MRWFGRKKREDHRLIELTAEVRHLREELAGTRDQLSTDVSTLRRETIQQFSQFDDRSINRLSVWAFVAWAVPATFIFGLVLQFVKLVRSETRGEPSDQVMTALELVVALILLSVAIRYQSKLFRKGVSRLMSDLEYEMARLLLPTLYIAVALPFSRWVNIAIENSGHEHSYRMIATAVSLVGWMADLSFAMIWISRKARGRQPSSMSSFIKYATPSEVLVFDVIVSLTAIILMTTINPWNVP